MADVLLVVDSSDVDVAMTVTEVLRRYVEQSKAPNTLRAYDSDLRHYQRWCHAHHASWLPAAPQTVALYLSDLARTHKGSPFTIAPPGARGAFPAGQL